VTLQIDFLPFANDATSPNVVSQATWAAQAAGGYVQYGFSSGLAASNACNKAWRQSSVMTAALANLMGNTLNQNVLDSGGASSVSTLQTQLTNTIQALALISQPAFIPQGRLTPTTTTPVIVADAISATSIFYTPYEGNSVPVYNGTSFLNLTFASDLALTLTSALTASSIVDVFAINASGSPALAWGPAWSVVTPGSCARGTGAGTTALARLNGLWTNANTMTLYNGATTFTGVPVNQATYLGSLAVDGTAGQVSCTVGYGQGRKFGVWNAYHRQPIILSAGDNTASWTGSGALRMMNGASGNSAQIFCGLPEEWTAATQYNKIAGSASATFVFGVGLNSSSSIQGQSGAKSLPASNYNTLDEIWSYASFTPMLGVNMLNMLENNSSGATSYGTSGNNVLTVAYRG